MTCCIWGAHVCKGFSASLGIDPLLPHVELISLLALVPSLLATRFVSVRGIADGLADEPPQSVAGALSQHLSALGQAVLTASNRRGEKSQVLNHARAFGVGAARKGALANARAGSRTRVASVGGLLDAATLRAPMLPSLLCP